MSLFTPPTFCRKLVCVSDDPIAAAVICSIIGEPSEYVAVMNSPRDWHQTIRARDLALSANSIAKIAPEILLFLNIQADIQEYFGATFPDARIICSPSADKAIDRLNGIKRRDLDGILRCRPADMAKGLLFAKRSRRSLVIDDSADPICATCTGERPASHVVAIDDHDPMRQVIASNYAYSIDADFLVLPERENTMREAAYAAIDARVRDRNGIRSRRAGRVLQEINDELRHVLELGQRRMVTFVTRGFPYGYFYEMAPTTHLFSSSMCHTIVSGIYWARYEPSTCCGLLIDPGDFSNSETTEVAIRLRDLGIVVVELRDAAATVHNARLHISGLPYDFLFICSHCGEVGGTRITIRMPDPDGSIRLVKFDRVVAIASDARIANGRESFLVNELLTPVSVDGQDWFSMPGFMRTHFWNVLQSHKNDRERNVVQKIPVPRVAHSTAIGLFNGPLLLNMLSNIDVSVNPIIFNNSCVSFYDSAHNLSHVGARAYLGTLAPVEDRHAREIAVRTMGSSECRVSLPLAIFRAQREVWPDRLDRVYVHVGCHFDRLARPKGDAGQRHELRLRDSYVRSRKSANRGTGYAKDQSQEIAEFLCNLIS